MTKLLLFLLTITIAAIASMWFIENDGSIVIEWLGYRIQTSVAFAILSSVVILVLLTTVIQLLIFLTSAPKKYRKAMLDRKKQNGLTALSKGFASIAAGDAKEAKRLTKQATSSLGNIPLTKLLSAQTAQLEGNNELAKVHYTSMLESKETETIAIKGLLIQARQDGDLNKAIFLAEKAVNLNPNSSWAISILMDLYKITEKWQEAEEILQKAKRIKLLSSDQYKRSLALIYTGICRDFRTKGVNDEAIKYAKKAYELQPDFPPIAQNYAKLLKDSGNNSKAARVIEKCWKTNTHPALADLYMNIYSNESTEKRLKRTESLLKISPNSFDGNILVAKAAMAAGNLSRARNHLKAALAIRETKSVCALMAELEKLEESDSSIIDQWRQRSVTSNSDKTWICDKCNASSDKWSINCNNCDSFDTLYWDNDNSSKLKILAPQQTELLEAS